MQEILETGLEEMRQRDQDQLKGDVQFLKNIMEQLLQHDAEGSSSAPAAAAASTTTITLGELLILFGVAYGGTSALFKCAELMDYLGGRCFQLIGYLGGRAVAKWKGIANNKKDGADEQGL